MPHGVNATFVQARDQEIDLLQRRQFRGLRRMSATVAQLLRSILH